jgi:hypothetical protein
MAKAQAASNSKHESRSESYGVKLTPENSAAKINGALEEEESVILSKWRGGGLAK